MMIEQVRCNKCGQMRTTITAECVDDPCWLNEIQKKAKDMYPQLPNGIDSILDNLNKLNKNK